MSNFKALIITLSLAVSILPISAQATKITEYGYCHTAFKTSDSVSRIFYSNVYSFQHGGNYPEPDHLFAVLDIIAKEFKTYVMSRYKTNWHPNAVSVHCTSVGTNYEKAVRSRNGTFNGSITSYPDSKVESIDWTYRGK